MGWNGIHPCGEVDLLILLWEYGFYLTSCLFHKDTEKSKGGPFYPTSLELININNIDIDKTLAVEFLTEIMLKLMHY